MSVNYNVSMIESDNYLVRRTGLNRLSIIIDGMDEPITDPKLVIYGQDAVLYRDERTAIHLPLLPAPYLQEIIESKSILVGERDSPAEPDLSADVGLTSGPPVKRFYEAAVVIDNRAANTISQSATA